MDFASLITARRVLDSLWKKSLLRGSRCWGPKREDNPFSASNIIIATGSELISVSQNENGELRIHEFSKTENTSLGKEARAVLQSQGLSFEK